MRLLAVDPHELITWGLRTVLTQQPWVERCLQANDLAQAGVLAARYTPHVILVDGSLADGGDFHDLQHASPTSRLVVMTERQSVPARLLHTVRACGFVSKAWGIEEIVAAVRLAGLGLGLAPPELSGDAPQLTPREEQVLSMIARGETNDADRGGPQALAEHRQAAREQRVPQARRAQPHRSGAARTVPRADHMTPIAHSGVSGAPLRATQVANVTGSGVHPPRQK